MRLLRLVPLVSGVAALWLMLGPGAGYAQEEEEADFGRTGFYIGVGGALTSLMEADGRLEEDLLGLGEEFSVLGAVNADAESSFGINGRGGYRFHPHFAAELEIDWHSPFGVDYASGTIHVARGELEPLVFTANAKGYLFKDRFQPYAALGIGVMTVEDDRFTGFAARFGGGVDLYVTEHIVLNTEVRYVLPTGSAESFDMISFGWGLQYRF
jgi:opacity protein-like surface antigen